MSLQEKIEKAIQETIREYKRDMYLIALSQIKDYFLIVPAKKLKGE